MTGFSQDYNADQDIATVSRTLPLSQNSLRLAVVSKIPVETPFRLKHIRTSVVLLNKGPHAGKTATIVEIIDHNRVCISELYAGVAFSF